MKLWLISQDTNEDYETYDSAVVAAETEEGARLTHPGEREWSYWPDWVENPDLVKVVLLGEAVPDTKAGVILSSYRAG